MSHPRSGFGAASSRSEDRNNSSICGLKSARVAALTQPAELLPLTFAHILVATTDSVVLGSQLDDVDLYRPIVEMYVSVIKMP